jgi:integrase
MVHYMKVNDSAMGKHHVVVVQRIKGIHDMTIPALYLSVNHQSCLFGSLVEYFISNSGKSLSWMRNAARAVGLVFDYISEFQRVHPSFKMDGKGTREVMRRFAFAHTKGTIDTETGEDRLELYWPPSTVDATKRYISAATNFIIWCEAESLIEGSFAKETSTLNEQSALRFLRIAKNIKQKSMLGHIYDAERVSKNLSVKRNGQFVDLGSGASAQVSASAEGKIFPTHLIVPLLEEGFKNNDDSEDITAKLFTMLLLFGGLRVSEPCHLWFNDISPQLDGTLRCVLRHPAESLTHFDKSDSRTRALYLKEIGLLPRNDSANSRSYHAGWKDLALGPDKSATIWIIHEGAEKMIAKYYLKYLRYRTDLMKVRRRKGLKDHPFLFVRQDIDGSGEPYSISAYVKALERAYDRLESLGINVPRGKYAGTSPHGPRHWYGQTLENSNLPNKVIQQCMHHKNVLSQEIYTSPSHARIKKSLDDAKGKISTGSVLNLPLSIAEFGHDYE